MLLMLILAIKGPDLAMQDPMQENYAFKVNGQVSRPPYPPFTVPGYPLGTDNFGRDLAQSHLVGGKTDGYPGADRCLCPLDFG